MAGELGSLVVSLSADIARFREDMGKSTKVAQDTMSKLQSTVDGGVKGIQNSLANVGKAFAAVTAVAAGGAMFNDMISATKNWNGEVMKLSKTMGMSVQDASAYNTALRIAGVDIDTATGVTAKLTKTLATNEAAFKAHGITVRDVTTGKILPYQQIISNTYEALGKLESGASRNTAANELLGKSFLQLSGMAKITNPLLAESKELSEALGLTLDGKTSEAVKKYGMEMNKLKLVHEAFKINVGEMVIPTLTKLETGFTNVAIAAGKMKSKQGMGETFTLDLAALVLMEKRLNSSDFLLHPIDTIKSLTGELNAMKKAADTMGVSKDKVKPAGEEYDPAKAAAAAAAAEKLKAEAQAAEAARLQKENEYTKQYNQIQTERTKLQIQESTELTATQKKAEELKVKYADLIELYPNHKEALERNLKLDIQNVTVLGQKADALKLQNAELKKSIELYEELNKDVTGFGSYAKGLGMDALALPQIGGSLGKDGAATGGMPKFSLTGAAETTFFGGNSNIGPTTEEIRAQAERQRQMQKEYESIMAAGNPYQVQIASLDADREKELKKVEKWDDAELGMAQKKADALLKINQNYQAAKNKIDTDAAAASAEALKSSIGQIGNMLMQGNREQFEAGKRIAEAMIAIDTAKAASAAFAGAAAAGGPWGVALGVAAGAAAIAVGTMNEARLEAVHYEAREFGGNVNAGQTYLVGEKGPELFTAGTSGQITSNANLGKIGGGGDVHVTHVWQISSGVESVRAEIGRWVPLITSQSVTAVQQAIDSGGSMSRSVGRR